MVRSLVLLSFLFTSMMMANGLNLNSNGSKALSMGGAFIGLADDYSAVFWNPAGLTQMQTPSLTLYIADVIPTATYKLELLGIDAQTESKHYLSGAVGFFKPLKDSKIVLGIYGYVPSGLGAKWNGDDLLMLTKATGKGGPYEWESMLGVITVSPAIAVKLSDRFSLGASLNVNYGMLTTKRPAAGQYEEELSGLAVGFTLGGLYKASDRFSVGVTFKTPFKVKLSGDATMSGAPMFGLPAESPAEREASWPVWAGIGFAYKPLEKLTLTMDLQYANWNEMTDIPISYEHLGWAAAFNNASRFELQWQDAIQVRFGLQYMMSETLALRCGYYHDPSPNPMREKNNTHNILLPQATYNWGTFGLGISFGKLTVDAAVEYGFGSGVTVLPTEVHPTAGMMGTHGINILAAGISLTLGL
jgi:long-chain fatty acid transport protein